MINYLLKIFSRIFDKVISKFEFSKARLEEDLEEAGDALGLAASARVQIERETRDELSQLKIRLANKHLFQVQRVEESVNAPFIISRGSRKVKGYKYIPPKYCNCNQKRIRPSKLKRRSNKRRYVVKFGPQRETMKEIIEAEQKKRDPINLSDFVLTEPMKEVLRLGATFAPTPTQQIDTYKLYIDFQKWADNLRWHHLFNKSDPEAEDNFVKKPWHKPTDRRAPRGNDALEAFIFRCHEQLFDPDNRRKIHDNLTPDQRGALKELMSLVADHGVIVRFEDKGSRFVLDTVANHDAALLEDLNDDQHYDKLPSNPIADVIGRVGAFAEKWETDLDEFHPNIRSWMTSLEEAEPGKTKGLVKCHKPSLANGKKPYRLLLCGTNTPVQPLSKFVQDSIKHLVSKLKYKARDTKHIHQIITRLNRTWQAVGGLPVTAKQVGCDVRKLYPSCCQEDVRTLSKS